MKKIQTFDSIALSAVRSELQELLLDARLERVHQPSAEEMVWIFRGKTKLFFSTRIMFNRLHLTEKVFENPAVPPAFCMLLRKHLEGCRIREIDQKGLERVITFVFEGHDELGDPTKKLFVAEITGKHSNLILLNEQEIVLGALRAVTAEMSSHRQILVGHPYAPPPPFEGKASPFDKGVEIVLGEEGSIGNALNRKFAGLSKLAIAQICLAAGIDPCRPVDSLEAPEIRQLDGCWKRALEALREGKFDPRFEKGRDWDYCLWKFAENSKTSSPSRLLDRYYGSTEEEDRLGAKKKRLAAEIFERLEKKEELANKLKEGLQEAEKSDGWRLWGELLNTYAREVQPFSPIALLPNYQGEIEKIPLDPGLSPTENSQRFFKKYRKAKMVREVNHRMLFEIAEEVAYLEGVLASIDFATEKGELEEIQAEIAPPKKEKKGARPSKKGKVLESLPLHFLSRDGYEILVGKNNRQNDILTMKNSVPLDWWLHAQNIPGSHVVVKSQGEEVLPEKTLVDAAGLAAYYSRARESTKVPVVCLRRRQVKKPPGAKPGLVIYSNEKVVLVAPWDGGKERRK